jgi:hypothetical protein
MAKARRRMAGSRGEIWGGVGARVGGWGREIGGRAGFGWGPGQGCRIVADGVPMPGVAPGSGRAGGGGGVVR